MDPLSEFIRGITRDNPTFGLVLGLCPTLAVTTSVENAIGMSAGTAFVLVFSNLFVSLMRKQIPSTVRLPIFIIIIATFVSIVDMIMEAYSPSMYAALGVFIPLIVVNCIIIGRAEAYANRNGPFYSVIDAIGISTGFLLVLMLIGGIREILGSGQIVTFGHTLITLPINPSVTTMILPPGAFLTIGILMAIINYQKEKKRVRGE
ncbi:MAG: electron transport complex RsxE subunit [Methanomethylovorans sp. PtaU1.Bin093]|jgi:electron transport complex protein RnfE|uniref:Rnf electron transport complex subunit RnfE n=1 Tax=Methanomethylovorans sp. PtaU1.Bin093 TaxID=1811679 RepID=UPI0009CD95C6|nr:Rnf electron transport complex subunit RnfE [Methanomethylovorans sp. PtaU1.Bin093]OPY20675.1 MAG: electron transport complex RsxE subunit [Methanomethylovorans sp. PtaU1.Bin093]